MLNDRSEKNSIKKNSNQSVKLTNWVMKLVQSHENQIKSLISSNPGIKE